MTHKTHLLATALIATGMAFAAATAQAETGVSKDSIKIGMFGPLTGASSMFGYPINNGAIAIYKEVNEKGGIHGRKIEIVHEDGACDPAKTRAAAKKLVHSDQVFMVHGGSCSAAVVASRDEFVRSKVPFMVMAATLDRIVTPANRYVYTTTLPSSGDGRIMFEFVKTIPDVKRVAIVKHANEWADSRAHGIDKQITAAGFDFVGEIQLDPKASDATSQVLKLKDLKPDAVMMFLYPGESAVFLRDARKYSLSVPMVGGTVIMDLQDLADRAGSAEAVETLYAASFLRAPVDDPSVKTYADLYRKHFPNDKLQTLSFYGMSGAITIVNALEKAGPDLTRETFIDALAATSKGDAGPSYCEVTFTKDSHQGCTDGTMWALRGGKIVNVGPSYREIK